MKRIAFSITNDQCRFVRKAAKNEGMAPSTFAKRALLMTTKNQCAWFECNSKQGYPIVVHEDADRCKYSRIQNPADVANWLRDIAKAKQEILVAMTLDSNNNIIHRRIVTVGLINCTHVHPREVFYGAITDRAVHIIIAHNHPSGNLKPSQEDKDITLRLKASGKIIGIEISDHIIVTSKGYFSFFENSLL